MLYKQKKVLLEVNMTENGSYERMIDSVIATLTEE